MATSTVTRAVRHKPAPRQTPRGWLAAFNWRRPFDALWGLFSSVRLAITLIASLIALCFVGVIIAQAPAEVVSSPLDYAAWVATNAHQQYGQFTDLLNWLQMFTIFQSWYFKTLVVLLALNIFVGGMLNRAPGIWQKFRHPQLRRADGFFLNSPVRAGVTLDAPDATTAAVAADLTTVLRRRGYRVTAAPGNGDVGYYYVHKHAWSALSTFVFHTCLISVMFSAVLTGWSGFGPNSMAQRLLPAPVYSYFQNLAGFSYSQPLPNGSQGIVYPMGTPHNIIYRAQQFVMTVDTTRMQPTDFYTDLQVFQDGKLVAQQRIRVNDPLSYQGVTFHQASFMMYASVEIRDAAGNVIFNGPEPLLDQRTTQPDPNSGNILQTNNAIGIPIASYGDSMNIAAAFISNGDWYIGLAGFDSQNKPLFTGVALVNQDTPGQDLGCVASQQSQPSAPGQYGCQLSNGWYVHINDLRRGTILLVTKDSGSPLLWPILALLVISLWVTFSFPPRRFWLRLEGDQARFAALKEHTVNLQRDLDDLVRVLGGRPLRETPPDKPPEKGAKPKASGKADAKPPTASNTAPVTTPTSAVSLPV